MKHNYILSLLIFFHVPLLAQEKFTDFLTAIPAINPTTKLYKVTKQDSLFADIYYPIDLKEGEKRPCIVFFFGGGWVNGDRNHFQPQSRYLASKGMIAITVDYRIKSKHGTSPIFAMQDARSAMRWVKLQAKTLGIDETKIAAGGGSAGGHLAAVTGILKDFDEPEEDISLSCLPNALVLFNPVIDTTPKGYGAKKMDKYQKKASPVHHVKEGVPPTIIFHGTEDTTVPFENVKRFQQQMKKKENRCELHAFEGEKHGFFNIRKGQEKYFVETVKKMESFLKSLGYIRA